MSKIADYLRKLINGEVLSSEDILNNYSSDASILEIKPQFVVFPRSTTDVRKIFRMVWQLGEQGKKLPVTARGSGTDLTGAAIGSGIIIAMPEHMNKLIELDTDKNFVVVQPGMSYSALQTVLYSHGRFLPPSPTSVNKATIGGSIANNSGGYKSVKYGNTKAFVSELEVVLANGEVINTKRLSKRELNRKKGLTNFEGEIYRQLDGLIVDNAGVIAQSKLNVTKNVAGYNIADVKQKDGSFDLTPLFLGAQGTLGVVTKAKLRIIRHQPKSTVALVMFPDIDKCASSLSNILSLSPSAVEFIDTSTLKLIESHYPNALNHVYKDSEPKTTLIVEFDDANARTQQRKAKRLVKLLSSTADEIKLSNKPEEIAEIWQVRESVDLLWYIGHNKRALPLINDAVVSPDKVGETIKALDRISEKLHIDLPIYGHIGDGNINVAPMMDLKALGDRQKIFKLADEYYKFIIENGGSITGELGDGRIRGAYLEQQYGEVVYRLFKDIKSIFDPHTIMNPGVKIDVSRNDVIKNLSSTRL